MIRHTKLKKTNAIRLLENELIPHQIIAYQVDESDLSATHVAQQLGQPPQQVFKTLVIEGDKTGYLVCIIPARASLDLKQVAKISKNKYCQMIQMKDLLQVTGYIRGACSPIGMKKKYATYIDSSCLDLETIYVSAGQRGLQIQIAPSDLIHLADMHVSCLITSEE